MSFVELWCEECGARWREQCSCPDQPPMPTRDERWIGVDGHAYRGELSRPTLALHDVEHCDGCRKGAL